jgi:hypothetical protein
MKANGNFVIYATYDWRPFNIKWSSNTNGQGVGPYKVVMQDVGNLVIYEVHKILWSKPIIKEIVLFLSLCKQMAI